MQAYDESPRFVVKSPWIFAPSVHEIVSLYRGVGLGDPGVDESSARIQDMRHVGGVPMCQGPAPVFPKSLARSRLRGAVQLTTRLQGRTGWVSAGLRGIDWTSTRALPGVLSLVYLS